MARSIEEIASLMAERRSYDSPVLQRMAAIRDKYNGETVVLLPDVKGEPTMVPPTAQIVTDAVDFLANRASSVRPSIDVPVADVSDDDSRRRAFNQRKAYYAIWYESQLAEVLIRRFYRHYFAYGSAAMVAMPDPDVGVRIEARDPLTSYPELRTPDDVHSPLNVGFVYGRSGEWLAKKYPEAASLLSQGGKWDRLWDMVEWIDEEDVVLGILGPRYEMSGGLGDSGIYWRNYNTHMELRRWPNMAGMVPVAVPRRVTLDRVMGQVWAAVGMQQHLERFTALEITAAEKYVFPDMVVLGRDGRTPILVSGQWQDGRTGEANFIQDGDVKVLNAAPGVMTMPTLDRIQENAQKSAGLVPQAYSQTYGALRTGRALDALGGFAVDPRIMEAQEVCGRSLATLNEGVCHILKGYTPKKTFSMFSGWPGETGMVTFTPGKDFETSKNVVSYAVPGADATEITVGVGQLVGTRLMSRKTGRRKHPWIENAEAEEGFVLEEVLEDSVLQNFLAQGQTGALPLIDQARAIQLVKGGMSIQDAVLQADQEARERQAAQVTPPSPESGLALPPESQPGLALPGQGAEAVTANEAINPIGAPPQATQDVAQLFRALRAGAGRG